MPSYLSFYDGSSRLRSSHLDRLSLVSNITPRINLPRYTDRTGNNPLENSYFYRTHTKWNRVPLEIRDIPNPSDFKRKLITFIWNSLQSELDASFSDEDELLTLDTG